MTKQRDELEESLKNLPKYKMSEDRKRRNYYEVKAMKGKKAKYIAYPLTFCTFLITLFAGYILFFERDGSTAFFQEELTDVQQYFEGVQPIYSSSIIPSSLNVNEEYSKGVTLGYLYNSSIFYTADGEKVNPLEIDSLDDYLKGQKIQTSAAETAILMDLKPTWVYLNSADQLIEEDALSELLVELSEKNSEISLNTNQRKDYTLYKEVSREIANIVREADQVTEDPVVYEGENENRYVRFQPLDDGDYLLYFTGGDPSNSNPVRITFSHGGDEHTIETEHSGVSHYYYGEEFPEEFRDVEGMNMEMESNGEMETLSLERSTNVNINP